MSGPNSGLSCAVILSTYNSPRLLELVLAGYAVQTHSAFQLIIADDGSGDETRRVIGEAAERYGLSIRHAWQPDDGFRKCAILNKAIEMATADYLIFSDGDCIPAPDFVETHLKFARPKQFLSGGSVRLSQAVSSRLRLQDVTEGHATEYSFLRTRGMPPHFFNWLRLKSGPAVAQLADRITPTRASWNGNNASCWREDAVRANGFDERMGYGGEDREFGERLTRAGVVALQLRHRLRCVHLYHERGYVRDSIRAANDAIRRENQKRQVLVSSFGMRKS